MVDGSRGAWFTGNSRQSLVLQEPRTLGANCLNNFGTLIYSAGF